MEPKENLSMTAILLMAGDGVRFNSALPKQFHRLSGKKIYLHTLEKFLSLKLFEEILLICQTPWISEVKKDLVNYPSNIKVIEGGSTRQDSSHLALLACSPSTQVVVIHDAVRPFVSHEIILNNIETARTFGAVDTCIASTDTLVHAPLRTKIHQIPDRSEYLRGQTPQSFSYSLILDAHERAKKLNLKNISDDCRLVVEMGHPVHIVEGCEHNIKITTELDLFLAEQLLHLPQKSTSKAHLSLKDKRFAITGGTGGIGSALCQLLEKEGAHPLVISRNAICHRADLTDYAQAQAVFKSIHDQYGPIDGLINSLGLFKLKSLSSLSAHEIQEMLAVNFTALAYSCQCAKIKEDGHIVNIASSSYAKGRKDYSIYSSAKAAVVNFTQALSEERALQKINAIVPQRTSTAMRHQYFPEEDQSSLLSPHEVAEAIIELLKKDLTGTISEVKKR